MKLSKPLSIFFLCCVMLFAVLFASTGFTSGKHEKPTIEQSIEKATVAADVANLNVSSSLGFAYQSFALLPERTKQSFLPVANYIINESDGKPDNTNYQLIRFQSIDYHLKL